MKAMTAKTLSVGTDVRLKSGGPHMTVAERRDNAKPPFKEYECCWFGRDDEVHSDYFVIDTIEIVTKEQIDREERSARDHELMAAVQRNRR